MEPTRIGISIGDVNGIGPEVVVKSLAKPGILELYTPIIYASEQILSGAVAGAGVQLDWTTVTDADQAEDGRLNLIEAWAGDLELTPGQPTETGGRAAAQSLERATNDLRDGRIDALVTAPINKSVMPPDDFPYPGHTEMLTEKLGVDESLMFLVTDELRVGIVTNHVPVSEVAANVTEERIVRKLTIMDAALRSDFGIEKPVIAVLALNPHAGDEGRIGKEDRTTVRPAIEAARQKGILIMGPFPADGFFGSGHQAKFDAVLAMYHDQGLIPFKTLSFGRGVNYTAGLPAIRTSPDHGTAYDIVGQNVASPDSFLNALFLARRASQNRANYEEDTANPLESRMHLVYKKKPRSGGHRKSGGSPPRKK